jgi:hypothetical protein
MHEKINYKMYPAGYAITNEFLILNLYKNGTNKDTAFRKLLLDR